MIEAKASHTAFLVAKRRAAHQLFDTAPLVLNDPLAVSIIGPEALAELKAKEREQRGSFPRAFRAIIIVRSRFAEDELAKAMAGGVRQYVVLGAGLDTSPYRIPTPPGMRMFEVDHPATQAWKREQVARAGIAVPPNLTYVPVDFEQQSLAQRLAEAGFVTARPAFFSWLGVTYYLTEAAIRSTLGYIGSLPAGSGVVFDYNVPRSTLSFMQRMAQAYVARMVARMGEPFVTAFGPAELHAVLERSGFHHITDLDRETLNARYFGERADQLKLGGRGVRLMSAQV